jgi:hypothetical protein
MTDGPWTQYQDTTYQPAPWLAYQAPAARGPREGHGLLDAINAGMQNSVTGLVARKRLPDIVLDQSHSSWWERAVSGAAQLAGDFPAMLVGGAEGGAAGAAIGTAVPGIGNAIGATLGAGAGAFAAPTALRTALVERYRKGEVTGAADFLDRTAIVMKETGKSAGVGALTAGAGMAAKPFLGAAGALGAEIGTMTLAPSVMGGKLPEPQDFIDSAILVGGLHATRAITERVQTIYERTGIWPQEVTALAKVDPTIKADLTNPAGPEIPAALKPLADAQAVQDAVPNIPKAQEVAKEFYGPTIPIPGEPTPTTINYNYLNTPDVVKGALERISQIYETEITVQRRGQVPWEQTQMEAAKYVAELLGSTEPIQPRQPGTAAGAAELLARKQMLQGAATDMADKAQQLIELGTNASPEQVAAFLASVDRAAMIQAEFLGARAEAGRALNILKETKTTAQRAQQIQELISRFSKDPAELAKMIADMDNPASALKMAKEATKAGTWDKIIEAYKSFLVSGPITQTANIMGNITFAAMRAPIDLVASTLGRISGTKEKMSFAEPLAGMWGGLQATMDGLRLAKVAFMEDAPGGKAEHKQAIPGTAGYVIRTPFRALGAMDQVFRTMNERYTAYQLAARQAVGENLNPATREFRERVVEIANNPTEAMLDKIQAEGGRFTFNAPGGKFLRSFSFFLNQVPFLKLFVPFVQTPANVFKEMARMTPAAPIIGEWRADIAKGGPAASRAYAEMMVGTGLAGVTMALAMSGHVSGSGDPDPNKRRVQMASGWQPYSVKIDGKWYSYQRMQPVGTLMGLAADMAEVAEHMTPEERDKVGTILGTAFANSVTNQTFLQGLSNVVKAVSDPGRFMPNFIQSTTASAVPALLGQTAQIMDPYTRELNSIRDAVVNRIPGLRETLPPSRDPFGEPVPSQERLIGISPIGTKEMSEDPVRLEAARLGVGVAKAPKAIQLPAANQRDIGKVDLTPQQRDVFGDVAGHQAHQILTPIVNSPGWALVPDMIKAEVFDKAFAAGARMGKVAALSDEQRQAEIKRIIAAVSKRLEK